ncbi:M23 family metallopeptidase [Chryseobacterium potabilaquae]|uniref:Glycyl-glycine endopeptidase ALE-1 n=1 Tax=Chryseobacterium potabilaquae TaxID=2675057 RepID=A0A6N4XEB0_9FLAO|nr:M23 family metallopeptidase [Chryseobacterium potabilaquae]CAA7196990.1 Glycyl-glycine endopeptidase ALE-1 [Chryseobacterium potabilaquae]
MNVFNQDYKYTFFLLLCSVMLSAQFNTLVYAKKIEEKVEGFKKQEINTDNFPEIKKTPNRTIWKKIFGTATKADLKKEIDTLKSLIIDYNETKKEKGIDNFKKIKDSLLQYVKEERQKNTVRISKPYTEIDFIKNEKKKSYPKICMPLKHRLEITSPYSVRMHPIFRIKKMHNGVDLKAHYEDVHSVLDGIVKEVGWDVKGGGNYIKIGHAGTFETSYLHLSRIYYKVGEQVKAGFIIGRSGNSGNSTGPHLHFAVKKTGKYINPSYFLNDLIKINNLISTYYDNEYFTNR